MAEEQLDETETYVGAALAFRVWVVNTDDQLVSIGLGNTVWRPGINVAYCGAHLAPQADCSCGLYGYHSWQEAAALAQRLRGKGALAVVGCLALRGRACIHYDGLRGEEAVITALALPLVTNADEHERLRRVASVYGAPLVELEDLEAEGLKHAAPAPAKLIPTKRDSRSVGAPGRASRGFDTIWLAFNVFISLLALTIMDTRQTPYTHLLAALVALNIGCWLVYGTRWLIKKSGNVWPRGLEQLQSIAVIALLIALVAIPTSDASKRADAERALDQLKGEQLYYYSVNGRYATVEQLPDGEALAQRIPGLTLSPLLEKGQGRADSTPGLTGSPMSTRCLQIAWDLGQDQVCLPRPASPPSSAAAAHPRG